MTGGLLQLATVGKEDSVLTNNPELFHFKNNYLQHSNFSCDQNSKNFGNKKFDSYYEFNIDKNSDLLRDFYFKIDIPFFEIAKQSESTQQIFNRSESDKIYLNILNSKAYVFNLSNDKFFIYPEFLFNILPQLGNTIEPNIEYNELLGSYLINISSEEYSKYYNTTSEIKNFSKIDDSHNKIIKYLTTKESFWFNKFLDLTKLNDFNINLMDLNNFYKWLGSKIDNVLLYDYQFLNNLDKNYNFYQHNFIDSNNKTINEVFKYIILKNNNFKLGNYYSNDNLDIDKAISYLNSNQDPNFDLSSQNNKDMLLYSVIFSGNFLYYLLKIRFDNSYSNFFTFYHKYTVSTDNENDVRGLGEGVYTDLVWTNFFNKYIEQSFNGKTKDELKLYQLEYFNKERFKVLINIENLWKNLSLRNANNELNVVNIYCIIYTIAFRYINYSNFSTINWNDFLLQTGEIGYKTNLNTNINNYKSVSLSTEFSTYGDRLDFSLIITHLVYLITEEFQKIGVIENLASISKNNIQFFYWCRNKIANMIFIRFRRLQYKNAYPSFSSISNSDELINFYYSYVANHSITLNEVKNYFYRIFHNNTYTAFTGRKVHAQNEYGTISKLSQISLTEYNSSTISNLSANFVINVDLFGTDFQNVLIDGIYYIKILKDIDFLPDNNFDLKLYYEYENKFFDVESFFMMDGYLHLKADVPAGGFSFSIYADLNMPINKYYFDYQPLVINKVKLDYDVDMLTFFSTKYIDTDLFDFKFVVNTTAFSPSITFLFSTTVEGVGTTYSFILNENSEWSQELFSSTTVSNYTIALNTLSTYTTINISTTEFNDITYLSLVDTSGNITSSNADSFFLVYQTKSYPLTLLGTGTTGTYAITNLENTHESLGFASGSYYLEKRTQVLTENEFSSSSTTFQVNTVDLSDNNQFLLNTTELTTLDTSASILIGSQYYNTGLKEVSSGVFVVNNPLVTNNSFPQSDLSNASYFKDFTINFAATTTIDMSSNTYLWTIIKPVTGTQLDLGIIPIINDVSNTNYDWQKDKFKYKMITNGDSNFRIVNSVDSDFDLSGSIKLNDTIPMYNIDNNSITSNTNLNDILNSKLVSFDFNDFNYYLGITFNNSKPYTRKKLTVATNITNFSNENNIYLEKKGSSYVIPDLNALYSLDEIQSIDLIKTKNVYYISSFTGSFKNIGDFKYFEFKISENRENYKKYISTNNTFYWYINEFGEDIYLPLQYPLINGDVVTMKFLGKRGGIDESVRTIKMKIYINEYFPNLLNVTSFYLNDAVNRVSDLMDYFIQTPMIIFLDENLTTKDGNVIMKNLPFNINKVDVINYIKLDDEFLHLNEKINTNQLVRYNSNLISSSFDEDLFYGLRNSKVNILASLDQIINTVLGTNNIQDIINSIEGTDNYINNFLNSTISKCSDSTFGLTSKKIHDNFNNNNIVTLANSTKKINISKFNTKDFSIYNKLTLDFYNGYDAGLSYSALYGSGKQIFLTNYRTLESSNLINTTMNNILSNYNSELLSQIKYVESNISWLSLASKKTDQSFNDFTDYQNELGNYLYDFDNSYTYELEQESDFEHYKYLLGTLAYNYYGNDGSGITIQTTITSSTTRTSSDYNVTIDTGVIKSSNKNRFCQNGYAISENSIETDIINYKSNNDLISDQFNLLGPVYIENRLIEYSSTNSINVPTIKNNNLNLQLNDNKKYFFIDDAENFYKLKYQQEIDNKEQKFFVNSKYSELKDLSELTISEDNLFIYDCSHSIAIDSTSIPSNLITGSQIYLSSTTYSLIDNQIGLVLSFDSSNIKIATKNKLRNTNKSIMFGSVKNTGNSGISGFTQQKFNDIDWDPINYILSGVNSIESYNYTIQGSDFKNDLNYFTFESGKLDVFTLPSWDESAFDLSYINLDFRNVSYLQYSSSTTTSNLYAYKNSDLSTITQPIISNNGILNYYNPNNSSLISDDTYIYYDERICKFKNYFSSGTQANGSDLSGIKYLWFFNGNIENSLMKTFINLELDTKKIYFKDPSEQILFQNNFLNNTFFRYRDKFYRFNDFILSADISGNEGYQVEIDILNSNVFKRNNEYYTFKNLLYPGQVNLNPLLETLNAPRHTDDMTNYKIDGYFNLLGLDKLSYQDIEFLFYTAGTNTKSTSFCKNITVYHFEPIVNTDVYNVLKYIIYKTSDAQNVFSNPTDSTIQLNTNLIDISTDSLINDFSFYIAFNLDNNVSYTDTGKVRYHNLNNEITKLRFTSYNTLVSIVELTKDKLKIIIKSGTILPYNKFHKFKINVAYYKNNTYLNNDIIFNLFVDDSYSKIIKVAYDNTFNFVDLQEPLIFSGERESNTFIKCMDSTTNMDFLSTPNNKFTTYTYSGNNLAKPNLDLTIQDTQRFTKKLNFMEMNVGDPSSNTSYQYTKYKFNEININHMYTTNWNLLGKVTLYRDRIYVDDNIRNFFSLIENFIILLNDEYYFLQKSSKEMQTESYPNFIFYEIKGTNLQELDIDFYGRRVPIFINLKPYLCLKEKIYLVSGRKNRIYAKFGTFKYGEIIQVKNCKLMILDYDMQFDQYNFKTFNKFEREPIIGDSYYSLGTLCNFTEKENLVDIKDQLSNSLINKEDKEFQTGDIIINNRNYETVVDNYIGSQGNSSGDNFNSESLNYGFENEGIQILIYKIDGRFYYFGNDLKSGDIIIKRSAKRYDITESLAYSYLIIKSIFRNVITFENNSNIPLYDLPNYENKYIFYKPYQPFEIQNINLKCNKIVSIDGLPVDSKPFHGIFKYNNHYGGGFTGSMKMINRNKIESKFKNNDSTISVGTGYGCFILNNYKNLTNKLYSFGKNNKGQLGVNDIIDKSVPTSVLETDTSGVISVSCGHEHTLAITSDNKVFSFGENENGQLGTNSYNDSIKPIYAEDVSGNHLNNIASVSSGYNFSMILSRTGKVLTTGDNTYGQLGIGTMGAGLKQNFFSEINNSTDLSNGYNGSNAIAISSGYYHSLILLESGKVLSIGRNNYGQLGIGSTQDLSEVTQCNYTDLYNPEFKLEQYCADSIFAGGYSSAILLKTGKLLVFGDNQYHQIAISGLNASIPTDMFSNMTSNLGTLDLSGYNGTNCINYSISEKSSSMLLDIGKVYNFGINDFGQLGIDSFTESFSDFSGQLYDSSGYDQSNCILTSVGPNNSLFLLKNGKVLTAGSNDNGATGIGLTSSVTNYPKMIWDHAGPFNEINIDSNFWNTFEHYYDVVKIKMPVNINYPNGKYQIVKMEPTNSITTSDFTDLSKTIYPHEMITFDNINFFKSRDIFLNKPISEISSVLKFTDTSFNKSSMFWVKYNSKYYYPLFLDSGGNDENGFPNREVWKPSEFLSNNDFLKTEGYGNLLYKAGFVYDNEIFQQADTPPFEQVYVNLHQTFYYSESSTGSVINHYPLFLDKKLIDSPKFDNKNTTLNFDAKIRDLSGRKYVTFTKDYIYKIKSSKLNYDSDILINGNYFKLRNIKSDLIFNENDLESLDSNYAYFELENNNFLGLDSNYNGFSFLPELNFNDASFVNVNVSIPAKPWSEKNSRKGQITYSVNNHLTSLDQKSVDFNYNKKYNDTSDNIYCYYTETSQDQVKVASLTNRNSTLRPYELQTTDIEFYNFYNDFSGSIFFYLENYVPIILNYVGTGFTVDLATNLSIEYYNFDYTIKPNFISINERILIEETLSNGSKIIHYDKLSFEDGLCKITGDIENSESTFMLNMINPIRICNKIVQFIKPNISKHKNLFCEVQSKNKSKAKQEFIEYVKIPIQTNGAPIRFNNKWRIEIISRYIIKISNYEIYTSIPTNNIIGTSDEDNLKATFYYDKNPADSKHIFYLEFTNLPKSNINHIFLKNINNFRILKPVYGSFKINNVPTDTEISNYVSNDNWYYEKKKIRIPVQINSGLGGNYFTLENYALSNIFENSSIISHNLNVINKGTNTSNKTEVEISFKPVEFSSDNINYLWNEYTKSQKTCPTRFEPFVSVKNIFNYSILKLKNIDSIQNKKLSLSSITNRSKSWKKWTSISFDNNDYYKSLNQLKNQYINVDSNQTVTFIDTNPNDSILLYEETINEVAIANKNNLAYIMSELSKDNYAKFDLLLEIRKCEELIFRYLENVINNLNFWKNPISNINSFLEMKKSDFRINDYCLIKSTENITDSTIFNIPSLQSESFTTSRIFYLDSQYDLSYNLDNNGSKTSIFVKRSKNKVFKSINELVNGETINYIQQSADNYQPYYGVDSHLLFKDLSNISDEFNNFIDLNLDSSNFSKDYKILTMEKILISTQWNKIIHESSLYNEFNKDFNDIFEINYNLDNESSYSGVKINDYGYKYNFGLESYNKILSASKITESEILYDTYLVSKGTEIEYLNGIDSLGESTNTLDSMHSIESKRFNKQIDYSIDSSDIFQYKIVSNDKFKRDRVSFSSELQYKLDILDGDNLFNDDIINIDNYNTNSVNFYSNRDYTDVKNVTVELTDSINISSVEKLGFLYKNIDISSSIHSTNIDFYNDQEQLYKDRIEVTKSGNGLTDVGINFDLISKENLTDLDYYILRRKVGIISQEISGNTNILKLTKHYTELADLVDQSNVYLICNPTTTPEYKEINIIETNTGTNTFYINDNNLLDLNLDYEIFGYQTLDVERRRTDLVVYKIKLEEDLKVPMYQINKSLPINYKIDSINMDKVSEIKIIDTSEILVYNTDDDIVVITVKVQAFNGESKFIFNDNSESVPYIIDSKKYRFDLGDSTNQGTQLSFSFNLDSYVELDTTKYGTPGNEGAHIIFDPNFEGEYYPFCKINGYSYSSLYSPLIVNDDSEVPISINSITNGLLSTFDNSNSFTITYDSTSNTASSSSSSTSSSSSSSYYNSAGTTTSSTTSSSSSYSVQSTSTTVQNTANGISFADSTLSSESTDPTENATNPLDSIDKTFGVKVLNYDGANKFVFFDPDSTSTEPDSEVLSTLQLYQGKSYKFDQSYYSNRNHPLRFSFNLLNSQVEDTTVVGTPGTDGAYVLFTPKAIGTWYIYCSNHGYDMGTIYNPLTVQSYILDTKILYHKFKMDRDDPLHVNQIDYTYSKYYIQVINTFKYLDTAILKFITNENVEYTVEKANDFIYNKLGANYLLLESSVNILNIYLQDPLLNFSIENNLIINDFSNNTASPVNILTFNINDDISFLKNDNIKYSVTFDNTYYHDVLNTDINFSGNITSLNLANLRSTLDQSYINQMDSIISLQYNVDGRDFGLKQVFKNKLPIVDLSFNQSSYITLDQNYLFQDESKNQNISIQ